jgi:hypothetical protein
VVACAEVADTASMPSAIMGTIFLILVPFECAQPKRPTAVLNVVNTRHGPLNQVEAQITVNSLKMGINIAENDEKKPKLSVYNLLYLH